MSKKLESYLKEKLKGIGSTEIADIFVFGSAVKGKEFPGDVDLCVVFRKKLVAEIVSEIEKRLKGINAHISFLSTDDFFKKPHSLAKTIFVEGVSVFSRKPFIQGFGFSARILYSYNISRLKPSEKVKFVYLLKGRRSEGMVKRMSGEWLADSCFIIPVEKDSEMLLIMKKWNIQFKRKELLVH
jgi:predicted nucleotidyltransferase